MPILANPPIRDTTPVVDFDPPPRIEDLKPALARGRRIVALLLAADPGRLAELLALHALDAEEDRDTLQEMVKALMDALADKTRAYNQLREENRQLRRREGA